MSQTISDIENVINHRSARREINAERQRVLEDMSRTNDQRENLVRKNLAAQRARVGAGGGGTGMSTDAVLGRIKNETTQPFDDKVRNKNRRLDDLRRQARGRGRNLARIVVNRFAAPLG